MVSERCHRIANAYWGTFQHLLYTRQWHRPSQQGHRRAMAEETGGLGGGQLSITKLKEDLTKYVTRLCS